MLDLIQEWGNAIYVILGALVLLVGLITTIVKLIKNAKILASELQGKISLVQAYTLINQWYTTAEQTLSSSTDKKEYVLTKIDEYCTSINVNFDKDYWSKLIDETIAMTKQVNTSIENAVDATKTAVKKTKSKNN